MDQPVLASMWHAERTKTNLKAFVTGERFQALRAFGREEEAKTRESRQRSASMDEGLVRDQLLREAHPEPGSSKKKADQLYDYLTHKDEDKDSKLHALMKKQEKAETASTMASMALVYKKEGRHDESLDLYNECLRIRVELLGEYHADTAVAAQNIGLTYYAQEKWQHASLFFGRAHKIRQKLFGDKDKLTKKTKKCWQEALHRISEWRPASPKLLAKTGGGGQPPHAAAHSAGASHDKQQAKQHMPPINNKKGATGSGKEGPAPAAKCGKDAVAARSPQRRASLPLNLMGGGPPATPTIDARARLS